MISALLIQAASRLPTDVSALESSISALESAISGLESAIATLERRSVSWEYWAWPFTFLVIVGVVMELLVIRHDWHEEMEAWALTHFGILLGIRRVLGKPSAKKLAVEVGSVVLIALGVAGELLVGIKIATIDAQIRSKSVVLRSMNADLRSKGDQLVALVTHEAGDAATSAKAAREELGAMRTEAIQLKVELSETKTRLEAVSKRAGDLSSKLVEVRRFLSGKHLVVNPIEYTKNQLDGMSVVLSYESSDSDAREVCAEIADNLHPNMYVQSDCGVGDPIIDKRAIEAIRKKYGLGIIVTGPEREAKMVGDALRGSILTAILVVNGEPEIQTGVLTVYVGKLPNWISLP
jgi:hypothetical protein